MVFIYNVGIVDGTDGSWSDGSRSDGIGDIGNMDAMDNNGVDVGNSDGKIWRGYGLCGDCDGMMIWQSWRWWRI